MTENKTTELVFILDRSGSMAGLESDTIGGFNAMLKKQRGVEGECLVSTVLFDHTFKVLHDRVPLAEVRDLTDKDYEVGGTTALLDAIGRSIHHIGNIHKYARKEDVPAHTMFIITTDGMENASRQYSSAEVKKMISRQEEKYGWEFLFVGANIDAVETAGHIGIRTNFVERAKFFLENQGFEFDPSSASYKDGQLKAIYLKDEVAGFAVHIVQK